MGSFYPVTAHQYRTVIAADNVAQPLTTDVIREVKYVNVQALSVAGDGPGYLAVGTPRKKIETIEAIEGVTTHVRIKSTGHRLVADDKITILGTTGLADFDGAHTVVAETDEDYPAADWFRVAYEITGEDEYTSGGLWSNISIETGYELGRLLAPLGSTVFEHAMPHQIWVIGNEDDVVLWDVQKHDIGRAGTTP